MKTVFTILVIFLFLNVHAQTQNRAGTLDSSFGVDGKVFLNTGYVNQFYTQKAFLQSDGKIVETGSFQLTYRPNPLGFFAVRYKANGTLDSTFGKNAETLIRTQETPHATGGAIQKDDKILISGYVYSYYPRHYSGIIIRLNKDGSRDSTFGEKRNGILLQAHTSYFGSLAIQKDKKIIAASARNDSTFINRFLPNGILDSTFGNHGYVNIDQYKSFFSCKIQEDGKIIMAGFENRSAIDKFCLQRFLPNGKLDSSFGINGTVITLFNNESLIYDIAFQSNGKIIATGQTTTYSPVYNIYFATARYNQNGSLDSTFGINGLATTIFGKTSGFSFSVVVQKNDEIIVGGFAAGKSSDYAIIKLTSGGKPDLRFGYKGEVVTDFGPGSAISSLLLQTDEKIIAAGNSQEYYINGCTLARYNNNEILNGKVFVQQINQTTILNKVFIYPNPATNILRIQGLPSSNIKITVVDFAGNIAISQQLKANSNSSYNLNIASLKQGNYLLKIETNDEVVSKQFVKEL